MSASGVDVEVVARVGPATSMAVRVFEDFVTVVVGSEIGSGRVVKLFFTDPDACDRLKAALNDAHRQLAPDERSAQKPDRQVATHAQVA